MTRQIRRKARERNTYINYLKKGNEYLAAAEESMKQKIYDAAALSCIHSVISLMDSIIIYYAGQVSASERHEDSIILLRELVKKDGINECTRHASEVLRQKNIVEYTDAIMSEKQAEMIYKHAKRFHDAAVKLLPQ